MRKKTKNDVTVVQSNDLIDTPRNLTLREYKLFLFLVSNINPIDDKEFSMITVKATDFADALGIPIDKNIYKALKETTMQLMTRVIQIPERLKSEVIQTHFISDTRYKIGKGYVELTISQTMSPLLLELKNRFTSYSLESIKYLTSIHSIRIYEMVKSFQGLGNRIFSIDDLRWRLGLKNSELSNFYDFNRRVLSIAQREINTKTDMRLSYEPIKEGRKVTQIMFKVRFVKPRKPTAEIIQLPVRKNGSCEAIGSISDNLLESFKPLTTTKKISIKRSISGISPCKDIPKASIIKNKTTKKKTLVSQAKRSEDSDILELKLRGWQRFKHLFKKTFME